MINSLREGFVTQARKGTHVLNTRELMIFDVDDPPTFRGNLSRDERIILACEHVIKAIEQYLYIKIYSTLKGYRVIILGLYKDPRHAIPGRISRILNTDELYWKLCIKQNCYRARLTPKPHRIPNCPEIIIDRTNRKPSMEKIIEWEKNYFSIHKDYATCSFLKEMGNISLLKNHTHTRFLEILNIHDNYTRAHINNLPLA